MICSSALLNNERRCAGRGLMNVWNGRGTLSVRLIVHVSEFRSDVQPVEESVWQSIAQIIPELRIAVHMLNAHETFRKYSRILRPSMPLSHLR